MGGPLLMHAIAVYRSDQFFNEQISKNLYNISDLTEICVPADNPGVTGWMRYVNMTGRVQFGETAYNYVKIRMTRTAIYLVCIPNYPTTRLCNHNIIDARKIPDIPVSKKQHVPFAKLVFAATGCETTSGRLEAPVKTMRQAFQTGSLFLPAAAIPGPGQPPDCPARAC